MAEIIIREAVETDAAAFLDLWKALDAETEFMLYEPDERKTSLESQKAILTNASNSEFVQIIVLDVVGVDFLAGFCAGRRSSNIRDKHTLSVVIGIRQDYTGKGWGFALITELEKWALEQGVIRLELSVMVNNSIGIALYEKLGFNIEGTKTKAVSLKSGYFDEYIMAKLI